MSASGGGDSVNNGSDGASGLAAVFMANRAGLGRFLRARGGGDDTEDLLQELWLKVSRATPGPIASPLSYIYRMANNLMLDRRRTTHRDMRRDLQWGDAVDLGEVSAAPSADRVIGARQRLEIADRALDALGERTATIFRRFRIDEIGQREIAAEQGISLSAVEKHLQRAYRAMVEAQRELDAEPPLPYRPDQQGVRSGTA